MPHVSIIIPTYNRSWCIQRCIQSIVDQTDTDYECLIIDDGSTDSTDAKVGEFLTELSKTHQVLASQFHYHKTPNQGVSHARNWGVRQSSPESQWIAFLDSDDIWHPDKLQLQVQYHQDNPEYLISQTQEIWIRDGVRVNAPKHFRKRLGEQFLPNLKNCMITPSSVFINKAYFQSLGGFDQSFPACEDYDLWIQISAIHPIGLIDSPLITRFGGHEDQLSTTIPVLDIYRMKSMVKLLKSSLLSAEQRLQVQAVLEKKLKIVTNGAQKRSNQQILDKIEAIREFLHDLLY